VAVVVAIVVVSVVVEAVVLAVVVVVAAAEVVVGAVTHGGTMYQAVSGRSLKSEVRFLSQAHPVGIFGNETDLVPRTSVFFDIIISSWLHAHSFIFQNVV
jgi:hypothetical protein